MSDPNSATPTPSPNRIEPTSVAVSPTGQAMLPQWLIKAMTVVVAAAGVCASLPSMGVQLPPVAVAVCGSIVSLGAAFGIVSQGARKV